VYFLQESVFLTSIVYFLATTSYGVFDQPFLKIAGVCVTCCSVLQCVAVCCGALQCVAVCCSVLRCVAVYCSVLQCVSGVRGTRGGDLPTS